MQVPTFLLERNQTLYENTVRINLTESGVHPASMADLLAPDEIEALARMPLGYGHTDGRPELREAIAGWHPGATGGNVVVAHGTSEANFLALGALTEPGDEIVVVVPNFMQLDGLARALGVSVRQVALTPEDGWQPDADRVAAAIGPRTRLVTLCDPNNPTGVAMRPERRAALAAVTERAGITLHVDEIYRGAEIDGGPSPTAWGLGERVVVTGGLSKAFGLPGLRLGWMVAPGSLVAEAHRRQDYTTIGTGPLAQRLAERALEPATRDRLLTRGRAILGAGRARVGDFVRGRNGWSWVRPDAGGMGFVRYGLPIGSDAFVTGLRETEGVFVCAGAWFGLEGHVRIGFGVDPHHLDDGIAAIDRFVTASG